MADVRPFLAVRYALPAGADASALFAPPYDVIDAAGRAALAARDAHNVIHLDLPVADEPGGNDPYGDAGRRYRDWLASGVLVQDERPSVTVMHQSFVGPDGVRHVRRGLVAGVTLERAEAGVVLPHEHTLSGPKQDRLALFTACGATASQVFCVYDDPDGVIDALFAATTAGPPLLEADSDDGVHLQAWRVEDLETLAAMTAFFDGRSLLIADGHHRYETHLAYRDRQREQLGRDDVPGCQVGIYLANLADPGTAVYPIHRLVRDLVVFDRDRFAEALSPDFEVVTLTGRDLASLAAELSALGTRTGSGAFGALYPDGTGIGFSLRPDSRERALARIPVREPLRSMDMTVLHTLVLDQLLGITKQRLADESHIDYAKAQDRFLGQVRSGRWQLGLMVPAPDARAVSNCAAAGLRMPQKSTFFFPKIPSGLVFSPLE